MLSACTREDLVCTACKYLMDDPGPHSYKSAGTLEFEIQIERESVAHDCYQPCL